ncbi:replication protein [Bacillus sp. V3B]|uniref:replication protein n=1 Tax=Bacillus sp. V3B TaxID=2804915 RepID=UPI00210C96C3|nr:replication protein [Bacillus sp. V3B]MCQ6275413.1 replication protein [Bacillus sp. V3B]
MTKFNGFQSPNFTQVPNEYLEYTTSAECDLTALQMRIMNLVFRETFGWHDKHKALVISSTYIMDLFDIKKRNSVVNALTDLVDNKQFLESIEVGKLSKKVRANIEKLIGKTLHPSQKIYRLNLIKEKKRPWDNAEKPHIKDSNQKVSIDDDTNQKVIDKYNQKVSIKGNQKVSIVEAESLDTIGVEASLNKGLNKDLNKEEEEVSPHSELISFLLSKDITLENAKAFETRLLREGITGYTNDDVIEAIRLSLTDFVEGHCKSPYLWAVGKLKNILDSKTKGENKKPVRKPNKPTRTEKLPDWFDDKKEQGQVEPKKKEKPNSEAVDPKKEEIERMLQQLRA